MRTVRAMESTPARTQARAALARRGVEILFEDNHLLVVAKPAGLLAQPGPPGADSLPRLIEAYRRAAEAKAGRAYVGLVHRLDRNASGVLVLARTSKAAARLAALWRARDPRLEKDYVAWVAGHPPAGRHVLEDRLVRAGGVTRRAAPGAEGARVGRLAVEVEAVGPAVARVAVTLHTGVAHQIRCQLALFGHPILGDPKYGGPPAERLALHARRLRLPHPVSEAPLTFEAPLDAALVRLDRALAPRLS